VQPIDHHITRALLRFTIDHWHQNALGYLTSDETSAAFIAKKQLAISFYLNNP
jgi:hypothetical protein